MQERKLEPLGVPEGGDRPDEDDLIIRRCLEFLLGHEPAGIVEEVGSRGLVMTEVRRLAERVEEQARENEILARRNAELQAEVEDLRQGLEAIEERARSELGMVKEDEQFYQVVPGQAEPPEPQR